MNKRRAFEDHLWDNHHTLCLFARRLTGRDTIAAEDLIQDTYLKALRCQDQFELGTNIKAWLCTIMVSAWRDKLDHRQSGKMRREQYGLNLDLYCHVAVEEKLNHIEIPEFVRRIDELVDDQLKQALLALTPEQRDALLTTVFSDEPLVNHCEQIGISTGALHLRTHKAKKKVRALWKQHSSLSLSA